MMRQMKWLAVATMLITAVPVMAQRPERGGPGGGDRPPQFGGGRGFMGGQRGAGTAGGKYGLLGNPAVQNELALSDAQKEKLRSIVQDYREALRPDGAAFQDLRDLPAEERREKMAQLARELNEKRKKVDAEFAPKYGEVLEEVQLARLNQIHIQVLGLTALRDEEVAKELKLSQEQQDKLKSIAEEFAPSRDQAERRDGPPPSAEEREARREQFAAEAEKRKEALLEVLTAEQKAAFEKLKGDTFDVSQLRRGPGEAGGERRGPGGDRGPGRPGGERGPGRGEGRPQRNPSL